MADQFEQLQTWDALARRLRTKTSKEQGVSIVTVVVFTNRGQPVGWKMPQIDRIEPKGTADAFAEAIASLCSTGHT